MPNIGITVERGITAVALGARATQEDLDLACRIFGSVGRCIRVEERYMDAVTAISGSGPAFVSMFAEALWEAGVMLGIPTDVAWQLALGTLESAVEILNLKRPWEVIEEVTTPGGVTIEGIRVAESRGFRGLVMDMVEATGRKGRVIAEEVSKAIKLSMNNSG